MGELEDKLRSAAWKYGDQDPDALGILKSRIEAAARRGKPITYSKLTEGVPFRLPEINNGEPYYLDFREFPKLDSQIISGFLGYIDVDSYLERGFFVTAFVVRSDTDRPSGSFFEWARELKRIPNRKADTELNFWLGEMKRAHEYHADNG